MSEIKTGMYAKKPTGNTPSFIKAKVSIKADEAIDFIKNNTNQNGYVNLDLKESQQGNFYFQLNNWNPGETDAP